MAAPAPIKWGGLINQGSTCYLNAVIQVLYHIPLFRKQIFEFRSKDKLVMALQSVFCRLASGEQNISTTDLTSAFGWGGGEIAVQHDVHELLQILLDRLEKQAKGSASDHFIQNMFCGELVYHSQAVETDIPYASDRLEKFYDLEAVVKGCKDLSESLERLYKPEKIEGVSVELSPGEKSVKVNIERSLRLVNLPPVLIIHPNRVTFDTERYELRTINSMWSFPDECDLENFIVDRESLKLDAESCEKLNENPLSIRVSDHKYILHAILIHAGTTKMGHYYAYILLEGQWICFNDEEVIAVGKEMVQKSAFGGVGFKNSLYETERASLLIYINESCMKDILNEKDVVIPDHIVAQKRLTIGFKVCGFEQPGLAGVDLENLSTPPLPYDCTLEELKATIGTVVHKDASLFKLYVVDNALGHIFYPLDDLEKFKKNDVTSCQLLLVPDGLDVLLRSSTRDRWLTTAECVLQHIQNGGVKFYVEDKKAGKYRQAKEADVGKFKEFCFEEKDEDGRDSRRHRVSSRQVVARSVVYVPSVCNGLWDYKVEPLCLESGLDLQRLQMRIQSLFEPKTRVENIYFIRNGECHLSFPPLAQLAELRKDMDGVRRTLLDGNHPRVFYTTLPHSYQSINLEATLVFNLGWMRQPRVFLQKAAQTVSLWHALDTALFQLADILPKDFVKQFQGLNETELLEKAKSTTRLLRTTHGSDVEEVVQEESINGEALYILEICPICPPKHTLLPLHYRFSHQNKCLIGLPTSLPISDSLEETGKVVLDRVWKRLQVPEDKIKIEGARWVVSIDTSGKKSQRVGLKDTLKSAISEGESLIRITVDRPPMKELDGTYSEKDSEALVISS